MKRAALLSLILLFAPVAMAQSKPAPSSVTPSGRWAFETKKINQNCNLTGEMQIWETGNKDKPWSCRFVATQYCEADPPLSFKVQQTCVVSKAGAEISITSKIEKFLTIKPENMKEIVETRYQPDDFNVVLNKAGDEMNGMFHSVGEAVVRFWRLKELTS